MKTRDFPGRFESLAKIGEFVRQAADEAGLNSKESYAVETAVDEACSNIIEHAYGGESDAGITCRYRVFPSCLSITLIDHGKPFDPGTIDEPNLNAPLEEQPGHGLGVFFIRHMVDRIYYKANPRTGNHLTLTKYRRH